MIARTAVILAAGLGTRLQSVHADAPKGFVQVQGETLIARSLRLLRRHGVARIVIVTGHHAEHYRALAQHMPDVALVHKTEFAQSGSMASLARALDVVQEDFLLLESDLFYESRALDALLESPLRDVVLMSGVTHAGDEVFIEAPNDQLLRMSKDASQLTHVHGELVGITRVSMPLAHVMMREFARFSGETGHMRQAYETDVLVAAARKQPVHTLLVPDLLWGEIDDASHLSRIRNVIAPAVLERESALQD